jgi:hypothetical protein
VCSPFFHVPQPIVADQHECQAGHDNRSLLFVRCKIQFCNFSSRNFFIRVARRHTCTRCSLSSTVVNSPPFGCLLGPTGACYGLGEYMVTYSSVSSACYCLDRRCVFKSLATPSYDRITDSWFHSMHTTTLPSRKLSIWCLRAYVGL